MSELTQDILDLDATPVVPVKLGGHHFEIRQQDFPTLLTVAKFVSRGFLDSGEPEEGQPKATLIEQMERSLNEAKPIVALMLGAKDDTERNIVDAKLTSPGAIKIFEKWWAVNEMDDFFLRQGNLLLHPRLVESQIEINAHLRKLMFAQAEAQVELAKATEEAS